MSKDGLVAVDAVGALVTKNISVAGQREVAVETRKVTRVPVVVHRLRILR